MKTTQEQIAELNDKVDKIFEHFSPKEERPDVLSLKQELTEIKAKISNLQSYDEQLLNQLMDNFNDKLRELELLIKKSCTHGQTEEEPAEDKKFTRRAWLSVGAAIVFTTLGSVLSFKYVMPAFPFLLGLFVVFIGVAVWIFLDEILFVGYSIGRMAKNANSLGLISIAISILYSIGIFIGNSYLSNPYGSDNERSQQVIERGIDTTGQQQPSPARSNGVVLPSRTGDSQGEQ